MPTRVVKWTTSKVKPQKILEDGRSYVVKSLDKYFMNPDFLKNYKLSSNLRIRPMDHPFTQYLIDNKIGYAESLERFHFLGWDDMLPVNHPYRLTSDHRAKYVCVNAFKEILKTYGLEPTKDYG